MQPAIRKISPFPATEPKTIEFDVAGSGRQVTANELEIRKSSTNELVYKNKINEFRYQHLIGENADINILQTSDFKSYQIPSFINLSEDYVVFISGQPVEDDFSIDHENRLVIFEESFAEKVDEPLINESNLKIFRYSFESEKSLPLDVFINGEKIDSGYEVDHENRRITFDETLLKEESETISLNEEEKTYSFEGNPHRNEIEIYASGSLVSTGFNVDFNEKKILFYQRINNEIAERVGEQETYRVKNDMVEDLDIEVYVDGSLIEEGYTVNYEDRSINFFFPPFPMDEDTEVEISYKTPFVFNASVEIKYSSFNDDLTIEYTKLPPEVSISQTFLENGIQYYATIKIFDIDDNLLGVSDPEFFYCFSNPVLSIPEITNGNYNGESLTFTGVYSQAEGEPIESYIFYLYDENQAKISSSGEKFSEDIYTEFTGFENRTVYHIELVTITLNGMISSTGLLSFTPLYISPRFVSAIELKNSFKDASIDVECNVIRIIGESLDEDVIYIEPDKVDLRDNQVYFEDGFSFDDNFSLYMILEDINEDSNFMSIMSKHNTEINLYKEKGVIRLKKIIDKNYIIQSLIEPYEENQSGYFYINILSKEGLFDLKVNRMEVTG